MLGAPASKLFLELSRVLKHTLPSEKLRSAGAAAQAVQGEFLRDPQQHPARLPELPYILRLAPGTPDSLLAL